MEVTIEEKEGFERVMTIRIDANRVDETISEEVVKISSQVRIPGFRPGKTPAKLLESRYRDHINANVAERLMQESYGKAMMENKVKPAAQPKLEIGQVARGQIFSYTASYEQVPEVTPKDYQGFNITRTTATVEDSDVDKVIEQIRDQNTVYKAEDDRAAESGDQVKIDFDGSIEGERFDGGKAEGYELILGSGRFIPGFEDQLIGKKAGEEVDVTVNFPEDYQAKHLAGKEALFKCRVHEVQVAEKPQIDDELATKAGVKEGGMAKMREEIAERLKTEAEDRTASNLKKDILDQLLAANPIEAPKGLVAQEQKGMVEQLKQEYKRQGMDPSMLGLSDEDLGNDMSGEAAKRVKVGMLLGAIAREESIEAPEEAVDAFLDKMSAAYGDQAAAMKKWLKEDQERIEGIRSTVLEAAIIDWIVNKSTVEEKTCTLDELMSANGEAADKEA